MDLVGEWQLTSHAQVTFGHLALLPVRNKVRSAHLVK